jgi:hypothetical protein
MGTSNRLLDYYLPPQEGFALESLVATTYQVDFEFLEEELLAASLGVRAPTSRMRAFRSELERRLQRADVTVLYDLAGCERLARLSPRIDPVPVAPRKLHGKVTVQMWTRPETDRTLPPSRRLRLVVGSANLTRKGFRENYECVTALDFGGRSSASPPPLLAALAFLRELSAESESEQLRRQLRQFEAEAAKLVPRERQGDEPLRFVRGEEVVGALREAWQAVSSKAPRTVQIISPFWPEGDQAGEWLARLVSGFGLPESVELVCRGAPDPVGRAWFPEFDGAAAKDLRVRLGCRLALRAARPDFGTEPDSSSDEGDETEDQELVRKIGPPAAPAGAQRALHAKMIVLTGPEGTVLTGRLGSCTCWGRGAPCSATSSLSPESRSR